MTRCPRLGLGHQCSLRCPRVLPVDRVQGFLQWGKLDLLHRPFMCFELLHEGASFGPNTDEAIPRARDDEGQFPPESARHCLADPLDLRYPFNRLLQRSRSLGTPSISRPFRSCCRLLLHRLLLAHTSWSLKHLAKATCVPVSRRAPGCGIHSSYRGCVSFSQSCGWLVHASSMASPQGRHIGGGRY